MEFLFIFTNIITPVFLVIAIGAWLHKKFNLDLYTLAKVNVYYLIPGFVFTKLYQTTFSFQLFLDIFIFFVLFMFALYVLLKIIGRFMGFNRKIQVVFKNSVLLFNAGNYGVPVNDLAFKQDPFAMSVQVIIVTFQNIFAYTFGIFSLKSVDEGVLKAMVGLLKMPIVYAMIAGTSLNMLHLPMPHFVLTSGTYIANAMIGIALLTLGAQVVQLKFKQNLFAVYISLIVRLILGPMIGLGVIYLLKLDGVTAQALFIASGLPSAVNGAIIAQEYNNEPELAAQIVLTSTIFSAFTMTAVIYFSKIIF